MGSSVHTVSAEEAQEAVAAANREAALSVHFLSDDWRPLCGCANEEAEVWAFADDLITCERCRVLAGLEAVRG